MWIIAFVINLNLIKVRYNIYYATNMTHFNSILNTNDSLENAIIDLFFWLLSFPRISSVCIWNKLAAFVCYSNEKLSNFASSTFSCPLHSNVRRKNKNNRKSRMVCHYHYLSLNRSRDNFCSKRVSLKCALLNDFFR